MRTYGWEIQLCAGPTLEALDRTPATAQQPQDYLPPQDLETLPKRKILLVRQPNSHPTFFKEVRGLLLINHQKHSSCTRFS